MIVSLFRLLGWDKVIEYASNEWVQDIRSYQLPHILKGVGPMHHVTQLGETNKVSSFLHINITCSLSDC